MRALSADEKKQIADAKKRANSTISKKRILLGAQIRACTAPAQLRRKKELLCKFDALSPVKGYPVILEDKERSMVIDYQLFRRLIRTFKNTIVHIRIEAGGVLTMKYPAGEIELYEIPPWQQYALSDLPIIEI